MELYFSLDTFCFSSFSVVSIGSFDGIHNGHRQIIARMVEVARKNDGRSVLITFDPHPQVVLSNHPEKIRLLTDVQEKISLLRDLGVDDLVIIPFNKCLSQMPAEEFVADILVKKAGMKYFILGHDHHLGHMREGGIDSIHKMGKNYGFVVEQMDACTIDNAIISSTSIRNSLESHDLLTVNKLLGYNYLLSGIVVSGSQIGRQLGFPTANIHISNPNKLIPANGVYAVEVLVKDQKFPGMMNIGTKPTFGHKSATIEVHLLDFQGDLYDERLEIRCIGYIREERKFHATSDLQNQLMKDANTAKLMITEYYNSIPT